jgi:type IV secretory pathway component VirB8
METVDPHLLRLMQLEKETDEYLAEMKRWDQRHRRTLRHSIWLLWAATIFNVVAGVFNLLGVF